MTWLWIGWACTRQEPPPDGVPVEPGSPPTLDASCTLHDDNVLRATCSVAPIAASAVRIEVSSPTTLTRVFRSEVAAEHEVFVWGLRSDHTYDWRAIDESTQAETSGTFRTDVLPSDVISFGFDVVVDERSEVEAFFFAPTCPGRHALIADATGEVIWYQNLVGLVEALGSVNASSFTEDGTLLLEVAKMQIVELTLEGEVLRTLEKGVDFDDWVHHDLFRRAEHTYAIHVATVSDSGVDYVVDALYVFDGAGVIVDEISFADLFPLSVESWMLEGYWTGLYPDLVDFTHANSVFVDVAGDVWISFRHLHTIARFTGGPGTPEFGTLEWFAVGDPASPIFDLSPTELVGPPMPDFAGQHDLNIAADGTIWLFDNGFAAGRPSRAMQYATDEAAGTLTALQAFEVGRTCSIQGSARVLPGGNVLVACAAFGMVSEFAPGVVEPVWEATASCVPMLPVQISRAIPVDL